MPCELSHLSEAQVGELMQQYYNGTPAKTLVEEYSLSASASSLHLKFPPITIAGEYCKYCEILLVADRPSKSKKDLPPKKDEYYCPNCGHKPYIEACKCDICKQVEINLNEERTRKIQEYYRRTQVPVFFSQLTFEEKVYLGAICRALLRENLLEITPLDEKACILTPTWSLCREIYGLLLDRHILAVSPSSPLEAFDLDASNFPIMIYPFKVTYNLNLFFPSDRQKLFNEILAPSYFSPVNHEEAYLIWLKIAAAECVECLNYHLHEENFYSYVGEKTHVTFSVLLRDFSVAQIYGLIERAVSDASKLYTENERYSKDAVNFVIWSCEQYAEQAIIKHRDLPNYDLRRVRPQSILSSFFFNRVLKIGEAGFEIPPSPEYLRKSLY